MDRSEKAKEIISKISYMTVATASREGQPWNSPVYFSFDDSYNLFWTSWTGTQHSQNIRENPKVFIVIYDSTAPAGQGEGVYIKANAKELSELSDIEIAIDHHYSRKSATPRKAEEFMGEYPRRMYKAVPETFWVNLDADVKGNPIDTRKEITL